MAEPVRILEQAEGVLLPTSTRAWLLAVRLAGVSQGARHAARYLASLPSWPHAFPSLDAIAAELGVGVRHARRLLAELSEAGLLERWAFFDDKTKAQRSNDYRCVLPKDVGKEHTDSRGGRTSRAAPPLEKTVNREAEATRTHVPAREAEPAAAASRPIETDPEHDQNPASAPPEGEGRGEATENPPPPQPSPLADVEWPSEERCRQLDGPGLAKARPKPKPPYTALRRAVWGCAETSLPPELRAKLLALPGGHDALSALAGARLSAAREVEVVERVLAYHAAKGVVHAGKFIHRPIGDVKNRERDEAERREVAQHDDWDAGIKQAAAATEAQRVPIPISRPPKPLPKRTKLEERRDTIEGTLALPAGFLSDEKRAALERELRQVEAKIETS